LGCLARHKKVWRFWTHQFNCCTCAARCAGALSCWNKVVTWHSVYRWQQYDVIMTSWSSIEEVSKRYHHNFLLCKNNEITACIADLFNSFLWRSVCGCIFQGSAATNYRWSGKLNHFCGQIISVWNSKRIIKIRQYLRKLCSNEKGPVLDSQWIGHRPSACFYLPT